MGGAAADAHSSKGASCAAAAMDPSHSLALPSVLSPQGFKPTIDAGQVPQKNVDACRSYLELPHFNKVGAAQGQAGATDKMLPSSCAHLGGSDSRLRHASVAARRPDQGCSLLPLPPRRRP